MSAATDTDYSIVVPTVLRPSLHLLLSALSQTAGARPSKIVVVVDLPELPESVGTVQDWSGPPIRWLCSGGRGPAAARNRGWLAAGGTWVVFLDDDVQVTTDWGLRLSEDLSALGPEVAASYGTIEVPAPVGRRPTDDERRTMGLGDARWISADAAFRRTALKAVGGFDERFPRAYREDADLALRLESAGYALEVGSRITTHPIRAGDVWSSVRAQAGNADNALMRRRHGPDWRGRAGEGHGRLAWHTATTVSAGAAVAFTVAGRPRAAALAAMAWLSATTRFATERIRPGPRTGAEVLAMAVTSVLIPPAAVLHRVRGEIGVLRNGTSMRSPILAVLFDRDDTLIRDVPYLADFRRVQPISGAGAVLDGLRASGVLVGVVTNQSGVASGRITPDQLRAVNREVERRLGRFDTWQICTHAPDDGCMCRKPLPGLILRAAADLGVPVERCLVIGDTAADIEAARAAGATGMLVPTEHTLVEEIERAREMNILAPDLLSAIRGAGLRPTGTAPW